MSVFSCPLRRPAAPYDLSTLDRVIRAAALLPPGVSANALHSREYSYSAPGMREPLRVTTDPDYFDQHPSSVELWSPGSPLFPMPDATMFSESEIEQRPPSLDALLDLGK
jgi:hypothetical protein